MSTKTEAIEQRTESLLRPIVDAQHFELVDVEYVKEAGTWYLRAYIDKEGGITVDDCEVVSRALEEELDRLDFIHTYKPINGEKFFRGTLQKATDEEITILTDDEEQSFSRKDVSLVRLAIDF